jgi:hypothetical protein
MGSTPMQASNLRGNMFHALILFVALFPHGHNKKPECQHYVKPDGTWLVNGVDTGYMQDCDELFIGK